MAAKLFLDTNIVLDFLLACTGELPEIEMLLNLSKEKRLDCAISESVIATSIYFLQKEKLPAAQMMREFCTACRVLTFNTAVLHKNFHTFKDAEDGLLYFLAMYHKTDYFITRNKPDFKKATAELPVYTPKQFLQHYYSNDL